jgi:hypothetical protein
MWTEWLGRTLGAHSAEDYAGRRARRSRSGQRSGDDLVDAAGSAPETASDAAALCPPRQEYG